ncbi:MAG TPA: hypothetical protein VFQ45_02775 [Longimicrobium sp.]|nr:hypothetical protein [Longimicrobium sp.]
MRTRYVDGPVLALLPEGEFGYTFDPNGVEALEGQGTVYPSARITADWGVLEVSGGVLMVRGAAGIERIILPAPADPAARPLVGDGWKLELAPGWRVMPGERAGDLRLERAQE